MITCPLQGKIIGYRKPVWMDIANRYPDDRECLVCPAGNGLLQKDGIFLSHN